MTVLYVLLAVITFFVLLTAFEFVHLQKIKALPDLPDKADEERFSLKINGKSFEEIDFKKLGKNHTACNTFFC